MNIRERIEKYEDEVLSERAAHAARTKGREHEEQECDIRTAFQRDRDRILHSKSFRRLKRKTQVFLAPESDHYRTRLTHTLEVSQIARTISRALRLNEDLTEAIALGHDLGHTPFGHEGERALNSLCPGGFKHRLQSLRVVEKLENNGKGLNLTYEVRDGIVNHSMSGNPSTLEGQVVKFADKIAYINHDVDDAIRAGILTEQMIPLEYTRVLGQSVKERLDFLIHDVITTSENDDKITLSPDTFDAMLGLRKFLFENLYHGSIAKVEEGKAGEMVKSLYKYFLEHTELLPESYLYEAWDENWEVAVCDYISGMTDDYAIHTYEEIFVPKVWKY